MIAVTHQSVRVRYTMKTLSVGLLLAIAGGLSMSSGQSGAPPSPQMNATGANPEPVAVDAAVASPRPSRRVARRLDASDRDSVLGIVLLITLQQGVPAR
ncbi:MAG: hypothetical protein DMD90_05625 [Candidatus Rokuibacteriota bacterium]|nr:MAG: hypothetical protein DMD90_05625 [Candidatus Rokubacteria bacterium]